MTKKINKGAKSSRTNLSDLAYATESQNRGIE